MMVDDVAVSCALVVDEFNFWSKFVDETRVTELGTRHIPLRRTARELVRELVCDQLASWIA